MKKLLTLAATMATPFITSILGCSSSYSGNLQQAMKEERMESGALCQGSKAWRSHNSCGAGECIKLVDGPFTLTEIRTAEFCSFAVSVAIRDTYSSIPLNSSESVAPNWHGENARPRWSMKGEVGKPLFIHRSEIEVRDGESLFVGVSDELAHSGDCCYIAWVGYRSK